MARVYLLSSTHAWLARGGIILGVSVALGAQQPTFRSGTQTVPLYITVTDTAGRLVPNLTKEDFTVLDNGIPQEISVFDNTVRPITSVVMLDTSGSMTNNLDLMKAAAEQFIIRLLPEDKAVVGAFNNKVEFAGTGFTSDRDDLTHAIRELDLRQRDPPVGRRRHEPRAAPGRRRPPGDRALHRRRRHRFVRPARAR